VNQNIWHVRRTLVNFCKLSSDRLLSQFPIDVVICLDSCLGLQSDELEALESIYGIDFQKKDRNGGSICIQCDGVDALLQVTFSFPSAYPEILPYVSFSSGVLKDFSEVQEKLTV
jgi:hypothetical protein